MTRPVQETATTARRGRGRATAWAVRVAVVIGAAAMVTCEALSTMVVMGSPRPAQHEQPARAAAAPAADRHTDIVDVPVSFEVKNVNRTASRCTSDGETYTIRGHLTAPAAVLDPPGDKKPPVTLYVHGTNTGEWIWRLDVPGRHFARELAERGHASVTIDRLGYGASDIPDGFDSCSGAHADIAHQIVQQLRKGSYTTGDRTGGDSGDGSAEGGTDGPRRFGKVFLGGHSSGALVAETVAATYGDVAGLVLTGWAAVGVTGETNRRFLAAYSVCQEGGEPKEEKDDPKGYVHFDPVREDFLAGGLGPEAAPDVVEAVTPLWPRNPCGVMASEPSGILTDLQLIGRIKAPVFLVFGTKDVLRQGVERYPSLFTGSDDVEAVTLARSGHFVTVDKDATRLYDDVDRWLDRRE